jgi:inositol oxygenase
VPPRPADAHAFRVYKGGEDGAAGDGAGEDGVRRHYRLMRTHQTVAFVDRMEAKWFRFDHARLTVRDAFTALKGYVDCSDPDTELPNLVHMVQTAEAARRAGEPDWFVLTCLVHDMGKLMFAFGDAADGQAGTADGPQYALGGDTWVVGAALPACAVYPELNALSPDAAHPVYGSPDGPYAPGCGVMALRYAFGHDEYMYRFALHNRARLPPEALAILRLHSCYPLHSGGAYDRFLAPGDDALLAAVRRFNKYDLYTKHAVAPDVDALWPYYQGLIDTYMPGVLEW